MIGPFAPDSVLESGFSRFVEAIGKGRESGACSTLSACLSSRAVNPLHRPGLDDALRFESDCADLPYHLRAYYLSRHGKPFYFLGRRSGIKVFLPGERGHDFSRSARLIRDEISTETFRGGPRPATETYQVRVDRTSIVPGTIFFDPDGHALVVYRIRPDGAIHMLDSQPNGMLSIKRVLADLYEPGEHASGGGFRRWRPFLLERRGPSDANGGFHVVAAPDSALPDKATLADYGQRYRIRGKDAGYWKWVRARVAASDDRIDAVTEFADRVQQLCDDLVERSESVRKAVDAGYPTAPLPRLPTPPADLLGGRGSLEWQRFSTPVRDLRLRRSVLGLRDFVSDSLDSARRGERSDYLDAGSEAALRASYRRILEERLASASCAIGYVDSTGRPRRLTIDDVVRRMAHLSFDPAHCAEFRWGAVPWSKDRRAAEESKTCAIDETRLARYVAQAEARSKAERRARSGDDATTIAPDLDPFRAVRGEVEMGSRTRPIEGTQQADGEGGA